MTEDYFTLLGLPRRFALDAAELEERYFTLQREHHPDRAGQGATPRSIAINRAYNTLKQPLTRAQHLLRLHGVDPEANAPPEVLMEAMEWRERLAEAAAEPLQREVLAARAACLDALEQAFASERWQEAQAGTIKLGYIEKLLEEIQNKAES